LVAALFLSWIIRRSIRRFHGQMTRWMMTRTTVAPTEIEKRAATVGRVVQKAAIAVLWGTVLVWILEEAGLDIAPILAGAGIVGLAVGFGAQNLVRDVISGLFILLENQVRVNDVAIINGTGGLVEEINLRTMVLRSQDGAVHVFPNGAITSLSNLTREFSFYVFETGIAYKENTDRVIEVLREIAAGMRDEEEFREFILEPLEVLGVDRFADSSVVIRSRIKTQPGRQWAVGREMNRRIKRRFDALGIEIPFPHRSMYFGESSKPIKVELELGNREEWGALLREVLAEQKSASTSSGDAEQ
jgi:small conductance mechanosensitive channel